MPIVPTLRMWRQEDKKFQPIASLGYLKSGLKMHFYEVCCDEATLQRTISWIMWFARLQANTPHTLIRYRTQVSEFDPKSEGFRKRGL